MKPHDIKLIKLAEKGGNSADLLLLNHIHELEDKIISLEEEFRKELEKDPLKFHHIQQVSIEGTEIVTIKGEKGAKGDSVTDEHVSE